MQPEVKEPETKKKEFTSVESWDQLSFQVIYNELVPKGFKEVKNGHYRGTQYVEVPKKAVTRTQKVAASLVRGFREKLKEQLKKEIATNKGLFEAKKKEYETTKFWQFKKKKRAYRFANAFAGVIEALENVLITIDNTPIK
jgi:hypothetical protein